MSYSFYEEDKADNVGYWFQDQVNSQVNDSPNCEKRIHREGVEGAWVYVLVEKGGTGVATFRWYAIASDPPQEPEVASLVISWPRNQKATSLTGEIVSE